MKLEEERIHLIGRVSALQVTQLDCEKTIEKMRRDQEEQIIIVVRHVPTQRVVLITL